MNSSTQRSNVFACPPGTDFPVQLVDGLLNRYKDVPPEDLARVEIFVNTQRMKRRIIDLFDQRRACLLPKIRLITDLAHDLIGADLPVAVSSLRRRLELSQLISGLLDSQPDLAPRSAIYDLADSLALLMDEMKDEGVHPSAINDLNVSDSSGHWQRSQKFIGIVERFFETSSGEPPDVSSRQRIITERLIERWQATLPDHPIIVAGSTGSRGTTAMLMAAVANLPDGAIILPGFDFDLPQDVWTTLSSAPSAEDHPQYRFAKFLNELDLSPKDVLPWTVATTPNPSRNKLISLALRPAPITDQWMQEGPHFKDIEGATEDITLIEAPSVRMEALAIALILRKAAHDGKSAALVTPDRMLTRQVTAALGRWSIEPDVSAGEPLHQTAPGRLLRHVAELFDQPLTAENLLIILKHPLVNAGQTDRGLHLLWTRELELSLRRNGPPFPAPKDILDWAGRAKIDDGRKAWAAWMAGTLCHLDGHGSRSILDHLTHQLSVAENLVSGPQKAGPDELWEKAAGLEAKKLTDTLKKEAVHGGVLSARDYSHFFRSVLATAEVREPIFPHPDIMIWGTLEARVQGADLVILGGLNDGVWPELPSPDPWMNREMRKKSGLLTPDRRVGLAAHDFQQSVAAPEVVITRSVRDAESETVSSRWLNRLGNLLLGMSPQGNHAYKSMLARGQHWLDLAKLLETPEFSTDPEPRPAPQPPIYARPKVLSVTAIKKLIRDPYAIYAEQVLRLRKLNSLRPAPDARLRGTVLHSIFEKFIGNAVFSTDPEILRTQLHEIADNILAQQVPWPSNRILWRAKLGRVTDIFLSDEAQRRRNASPAELEATGTLLFEEIDFSLRGKADRIDRKHDGTLIVYDYKTGGVPTKKELEFYDKQLVLEAMMIDRDAFANLMGSHASEIAHIGLGAQATFNPVQLDPDQTQLVYDQFVALMTQYRDIETGYLSRRAMAGQRFAGDFDHLARFGEWDESQSPTTIRVGL